MQHTNREKYVCKTGADQCFPVINTNRAAEQKHGVHDVRSAGLLRVFIRELNDNDSGEYKITVKASEDYSFFSEFNLGIKKDDCCVKSISLSAAAGGSVNISCKYPQSHRSDVKFLCWRSGADLCAEETSVKESRRWRSEGKIQLYDDREEQLLTGSISHVTEQDSEYWCGVQSDQGHKSFITRLRITVTGSSLLIPLVLVLLVLIIAGLLFLFLYKKNQSQGRLFLSGGDSSSQTGPGNHEVVSDTGCDYANIKVTHKQLPTNPSDFSKCIDATVDKSTGDSQCCITSAEDLNYAVVNFLKTSDCPDSDSIRNNQDYSEYAAVNHLSA
ncbi:uncharacterized protein [Pseudorasbora parva]|uniref:uncharacterized protein n=1 Tax=Pseudorasbora parva TaxID=51549 RepID=UPI00351E15BC